MKKVYQTIHTDLENDITGNCLQACIASLYELPLEEVPYFVRMDLYKPFMFERLSSLVIQKEGPPPKNGKYYIVGYKVANLDLKIGHAVIWRNGRIAHDPKRPRMRLSRIERHYPIMEKSVIEAVRDGLKTAPYVPSPKVAALIQQTAEDDQRRFEDFLNAGLSLDDDARSC